MSIDGTDCRIQEPTPFDPLWYSHKFNGPSVRYEVGICIQTGWIVWVHGPFPAGDFPDIEIFRLGLKELLVGNERVECDAGYGGDDQCRTPNDYDNNDQWRYQKGKVRARHEQINGKLKEFKILSYPFRHDKNFHHLAFNAVVAVVQSEIVEGRSKFDVAHYAVRVVPEYGDGEAASQV